jgi:hypothetical protein
MEVHPAEKPSRENSPIVGALRSSAITRTVGSSKPTSIVCRKLMDPVTPIVSGGSPASAEEKNGSVSNLFGPSKGEGVGVTSELVKDSVEL